MGISHWQIIYHKDTNWSYNTQHQWTLIKSCLCRFSWNHVQKYVLPLPYRVTKTYALCDCFRKKISAFLWKTAIVAHVGIAFGVRCKLQGLRGACIGSQYAGVFKSDRNEGKFDDDGWIEVRRWCMTGDI